MSVYAEQTKTEDFDDVGGNGATSISLISVSSLGLAALDADRRQSKRQQDLADIARIIELSHELRSRVPAEFLSKFL